MTLSLFSFFSFFMFPSRQDTQGFCSFPHVAISFMFIFSSLSPPLTFPSLSPSFIFPLPSPQSSPYLPLTFPQPPFTFPSPSLYLPLLSPHSGQVEAVVTLRLFAQRKLLWISTLSYQGGRCVFSELYTR